MERAQLNLFYIEDKAIDWMLLITLLWSSIRSELEYY